MNLRACTICGTRITNGTRCHNHPLGTRGHQHRQASAQTMASASTCWICGQPGHPGDPLTADHLTPLAEQGANHPTNYAPAHRSCNSRRGAAITNKGGEG